MTFIAKVAREIGNRIRGIRGEFRFKRNLRLVRKLGDASSATAKLIVDCGFNRGLVACRLLQGLPEYSLVGFEVQQDIQHFGEQVKRRFPDRVRGVIYSAVSNSDGAIPYYEARNWGHNYRGGTTTVNGKMSMEGSYVNPKTSPSIDFAEWIRTNIPADTFVFVKMDIEGAEYDVIEHLLDTRAIDRINVLAVEWHASKFAEPQRARYVAIENRLKHYAEHATLTVLDWY
jgi:FkbM family methyltransferase